MFHGRKLGIGRAAVALVAIYSLASYGYTPADADEGGSEICAALTVVRSADIAPQIRAELEATNPAGNGQYGLPTVPIALGADKWRFPDLHSSLRAGPKAIIKPGRTELEFLPLYDSEQANRHRHLIRLNNQEERTDVIEVLRFSFGRSP